jgi:hypothetical protein
MYGDDIGEVVLRPATGAAVSWFVPKQDYLPSSGRVAFTRIATYEGAAYSQAWVRAPDGTVTLLSPFISDSFINGMRNGQVMFVNEGYVYLGRPGAAPVLVMPYASGVKTVWLNDRWHVYYGRALYRLAF